MIGFAGRNQRHETFRRELVANLVALGCLVRANGVERDPDFARALVECGNDPTALFLRHQPDESLIVVGQGRAHLCEVKSTLPNSVTSNLSYELRAHEVTCKLYAMGVSTFVVFANLTAAWPNEIRFSHVFDNLDRLAGIKADGRGSGTPYGVFPQDAPFLKP